MAAYSLPRLIMHLGRSVQTTKKCLNHLSSHLSPRRCHHRRHRNHFFSSTTTTFNSQLREPTADDLIYFRSILSPNQILTTLDDTNNKDNAQELAPYNIDWTKRYHGQSSLLLKPSSTSQITKIVHYCHSHHIGLVPHGGNTGLCGGATPQSKEIIVSLENMSRIHSCDASGIIVADAGCILQSLQEYAQNKGYLFPLDIGSKGSCQIGGNVATNAGGGYFYRWGGLHGNVVGLEVVIPPGEVLRLNMELKDEDDHDLSSGSSRNKFICHRKDNTGYDLKHLFIGSEGTLGIITKVAVACPALPTSKYVALLVCDSYDAVLQVLTVAREELGEVLSAMELMDWQTLSLVQKGTCVSGDEEAGKLLNEMLLSNIDDTSCLTSSTTTKPMYLLVETQGSNSQHDSSKMDSFLTRLYESNTISNGFLASDSKKIQTIWNIREACNPSVAQSGYVYKYDVSVPIEEYMEVAAEVKDNLLSVDTSCPQTNVCVWGHLADGNAHINVVTPGVFHKDEILASHVDEGVYGSVLKRKGSISAEHGIGQSKNELLGRIKDGSVMNVMMQLKALFDPHGIMNPGKVLPSEK